jgi:hypothetical protein
VKTTYASTGIATGGPRAYPDTQPAPAKKPSAAVDESPIKAPLSWSMTTTPHWSTTGNALTAGKDTTYTKVANETKVASTKANAENKKRETEIRAIYDQVINMYSAGGAYGKGMEAQLGRERTQTLASGGQSLISSGMYNTTGLAGLSTQFAENVAAPTRAKLEDLRMDKLSSALGQKAGFVEGITNEQPDYKALATLLASM